MSLTELLGTAYRKWSLFTKLFGAILLSFYVISFYHESPKLLAITPGYFMPPNYYVWTLFTFIFFDNHFYCVLIDLVALFFANTLLEPLWGQRELVKYLLIVTVMSGLICFFICYFLYLSTLSVRIIFNTHIHGMIAYAAAITVAIRQTLPDAIIVSLPMTSIKNQHLPFISLIIVTLMALFNLVEFIYPCLFLSGIIVSWIYLRFYQRHDNGNYGDRSDTFEFARFFPNHLSPPVAIASNALMLVLVRLRICSNPKKGQQQEQVSENLSSQSDDKLSIVVSGGQAISDSNKKQQKGQAAASVANASAVGALAPDDAKRRKQQALRELKDRLQQQELAKSQQDAKESATGQNPISTTTAATVAASVSAAACSDAAVKEGSPTHKTLSTQELRHLPVPDFRSQKKSDQ